MVTVHLDGVVPDFSGCSTGSSALRCTLTQTDCRVLRLLLGYMHLAMNWK